MNDASNLLVEKLDNVLAGFKIGAHCVGTKHHRHFSFYDVVLDPGCRVSKLIRNSQEIALAMRAKTNFIVTPICERGIVRMQTTHESSSPILFDKFYSEQVSLIPPDAIVPLLLGETDQGNPLWVDLDKFPHLLVAGTTGSGKSTVLHTIISNILKMNDARLVLADTKRIEFATYQNKSNGKIIYCANDYSSALSILKWLYNEMESRYNSLYKYNKQIKLNKIVVVIDEIADLLLQQNDKEIEDLLVRLAQKSRAANIYLILATQRPSADILTGLIRANFPARIACKTATRIDSRVIIEAQGAENLAGRGDALLKSPVNDLTRFQVAYIPNPTA